MLFFSRWPGGLWTPHTSNSWVYNIKEHLRDVNLFQTCVSSEKKLILARIGLFGDYEGHDFTICLNWISCTGWREIQTCCQYPHKNRRRKVEREVHVKMAEEIWSGGESSRRQGDCKPNRTHTVTVILESMNKEERQEGRLSEHQLSQLVGGDDDELCIIWLLGLHKYCRGAHISSSEAGDPPSNFGTATSL